VDTIWNVEWTSKKIIVTVNDTTDNSFSVALNDVAYDMTGMTLNMIIKGPHGNITLSSGGTSPAITISTTTFNVIIPSFTGVGIYDYNVKLIDGTDISTIMKGKIEVREDEK
jgi:hypothetical protein